MHRWHNVKRVGKWLPSKGCTREYSLSPYRPLRSPHRASALSLKRGVHVQLLLVIACRLLSVTSNFGYLPNSPRDVPWGTHSAYQDLGITNDFCWILFGAPVGALRDLAVNRDVQSFSGAITPVTSGFSRAPSEHERRPKAPIGMTNAHETATTNAYDRGRNASRRADTQTCRGRSSLKAYGASAKIREYGGPPGKGGLTDHCNSLQRWR